MAQWRIVVDARDGNWRWEKTEADGTVSRAPRGFRFYIDCHFDAQRHGMGKRLPSSEVSSKPKSEG